MCNHGPSVPLNCGVEEEEAVAGPSGTSVPASQLPAPDNKPSALKPEGETKPKTPGFALWVL